MHLYLEWPDRRALLCDAEGAEYRWSSRAEPVAVCLLERWTYNTFPCRTCGELVCVFFFNSIIWLNSFGFLQISVGDSCLSSPTSLAASTQVWRWASCRIRSPRKRRAVRPVYWLSRFLFYFVSSRLSLTCLWPSQLLVGQSCQPISPRTTSNVWSCIRGAWWTTTSSWIWSQWWHASFSSSSSVTSLSQLHSV